MGLFSRVAGVEIIWVMNRAQALDTENKADDGSLKLAAETKILLRLAEGEGELPERMRGAGKRSRMGQPRALLAQLYAALGGGERAEEVAEEGGAAAGGLGLEGGDEGGEVGVEVEVGEGGGGDQRAGGHFGEEGAEGFVEAVAVEEVHGFGVAEEGGGGEA